MKYLLLFLIVGCSGENVKTLFETANKNGCVFVEDIKINGVNIGDYAICTVPEYKKRIKND
jgi:hypothetical protein|tara:strand:+ start:48 stop:230 length:183 start_codon:yes stop_codon:yes gene_type:complete